MTIPAATAGAVAGALAGRWIADVVMKHQPLPLFAVVEGAGRGLLGGAFIGAIVFPVTIALAIPSSRFPLAPGVSTLSAPSAWLHSPEPYGAAS